MVAIRTPSAGRHTVRAVVFVVLLVATVWIRGGYLARVVGGRYPLGAMLWDSAAMAILLLLVRGFDFCLDYTLRRLIGCGSRWHRIGRVTAHLAILMVVAFPFFFITIVLHPQRVANVYTPANLRLEYQDVAFECEGMTMSGWFVPHGNPTTPVVLVAHGLNANKSNVLNAVDLAHNLGYAALVFDFRGHGDSGGHTVTFGAVEWREVVAAGEWLRAHHPGRRVYALAYSMGAAAVIRAEAERHLFDKIVLDSAFAEGQVVGRSVFLRPFGPFAGFLWHVGRFYAWLWTGVDYAEFNPGRYGRELARKPLMLIHGAADRMIPPTESQRLFEAAERRAVLWLNEGAGHVESLESADYVTRVGRFLAE